MRDIGKNIKDLRLKANLTQEELAEKLFVTRQTVSNYENGKSRPDVDMIVKIGEVLETDANTVIFGIPAEIDRKRRYCRAIILTAVFAAIGVLMAWLYQLTKFHRNQTYLSLPFNLIVDIGLPGLWTLAGWWLMEMMALVMDFKPWNHVCVRYIRVGAMVTLLVALMVLLFDLAFCTIGDYLKITTDGFSLSFPYIPLLSDLSRFVMLFTYQYPILYSFFGIVFRLFGFPQFKKK